MCDACLNDSTEMKYKTFKIDVKGKKPIIKDGIEYGVINGYASTYGNIDRGGDIIEKGAFTKSIVRHKETNRPIRMLYQHQKSKLIGGFPIDKVIDDEKGLYVEGEINLSVPEGKTAYALALQGVLTDFSIGYSIVDKYYNEDGNKVLKELELWEVSPVAEPMNQNATITEVKEDVTPKSNGELITEQKEISEFDCIKDVEVFLKNPRPLSGTARKILISKIKSFSRDAKDDSSERDVPTVEEEVSARICQHEVQEKLDEINKLLNEDK